MVGNVAVNSAPRNAKNTIYDSKRMIGAQFAEQKIQEDLHRWPFTVVAARDGRPAIVVKYKGEDKTFSPEEVSAIILRKLKEDAEQKLGHEITDCVITCPAYFNDVQRNLTHTAGLIAGFNVLSIMNEPTAAAMGFAFGKKEAKNHHVVCVDLGGGTLDITVMTIDNGTAKVKATMGDTHLGGQDFDNRIVDQCVEEFKQTDGIDITGDGKALMRLKQEVEKAKRILSAAM